jgi:hypothetical protein
MNLLSQIRVAEAIFKSEKTWEEKYDQIFRMGIWQNIRETHSFDWYDPDTSCEEDVTCYINALISFREEYLEKISSNPQTRQIREYGICLGMRVSHKFEESSGTVIQIDENLPDITTCQVWWDNYPTSSVEWTNKLQEITNG